MASSFEPVPGRAPGSESGVEADAGAGTYDQMASSEEFRELRRRYGLFAFPATAAFLAWYVTYVLCNNWARGFMATRLIGHINVAVVFGLLQFLSTFAIAYLYARHAGKSLDPLAEQLHDRYEREIGR